VTTNKPEQIGTYYRTKPRIKKFLKRLVNRLLRREGKRINDPDTDTHPKRGFMGWD